MRRILNEAIYRFKNDGSLNNGGSVEFKAAGTSTDKDVYDDYDRTTTLDNPLTLDSNARASGGSSGEIYIGSGSYDITVKDSLGNTINTLNDITDDIVLATTGSNIFDFNGSFEDVTASEPNNWEFTDGNGSHSLDDATPSDGGYALKLTGVGTGGPAAFSMYLPISSNLREYRLSWLMKTSVATTTNQVIIYWYDDDKVSLAGSDSNTVYYSASSGNPTAWTYYERAVVPPADARWGVISVLGATGAVAGDTYYDGIVFQVSDDSSTATFTPKGMLLSLDTDTDHDINITAGTVRSVTDTYSIIHESEMTKQIDAAWAAGDDAGGLDTGTVAADSMYAVWAIADTANGAVDYLISLSFTAPTMPGTYGEKNLIGVVWTDASANLIDFTHYGNHFEMLGAPLQDVNDSTITHNTYETGTLRVPPNCIGIVTGSMYNNGTTDNECYFHMRPKGATAATGQGQAWVGFAMQSGSAQSISREGSIYVDSSSQVEYAAIEALGGTTNVTIYTRGCTMNTRGNPNL